MREHSIFNQSIPRKGDEYFECNLIVNLRKNSVKSHLELASKIAFIQETQYKISEELEKELEKETC